MKSIKVLVIDDSFTMRLLISDLLNACPEINVVDTAKSGEEALSLLPHLKPDCVTLDLMMPGMGGLSTLKSIMAKYPTPTVVLSAYSHHDAEISFRCKANGAASIVKKPSGEISYDIETIGKELIAAILQAVQDPIANKSQLNACWANVGKFGEAPKHKIIIIGASTGGPKTAIDFLSQFAADFPVPIVLVQHMPKDHFFENFIQRLDHHCWLAVKTISHGDALLPGNIYCLKADQAATFDIQGYVSYFNIKQEEISAPKISSIDEFMTTAANVFHKDTIGIILSGMGLDGVEGMRTIKAKGGTTIVQDDGAELFGMPKAVLDLGLADYVLPIERMSSTIEGLLYL